MENISKQLKDVLYCSELDHNLLSAMKCQGLKVNTDSNRMYLRKDENIITDFDDDMYIMDMEIEKFKMLFDT